MPRSRNVVLGPLIAAAALALAPGCGLAYDGLVERKGWGAKPADTQLMQRHRPRAIVIHHTAVRQQPKLSLEKKMRGLQGFSQRPGRVGSRNKPAWGDVPYHYYVGVSGRVAEGRSLDYAGDTNTKYDTSGFIQIVVEGDFTKEEPSAAQIASLRRLVAGLKARFSVPAGGITGHNDHASTNCPGPALTRLLPSLR